MQYLEKWMMAFEMEAIQGDLVNFSSLYDCPDEFKAEIKAALDTIDEKYWHSRPAFRLGTPDWNVVIEVHDTEGIVAHLGHEKFGKSSRAGWTQVHRLSEHVVLVLEVGDPDHGRGRKKMWRLLVDEAIWPTDYPTRSLWGDTPVRNYPKAKREIQIA